VSITDERCREFEAGLKRLVDEDAPAAYTGCDPLEAIDHYLHTLRLRARRYPSDVGRQIAIDTAEQCRQRVAAALARRNADV
jgi:hypothetical protein